MEKVLNEFVKWFNERNSYPIYPCEKDVKMFLSFKTNEPCERKADSNNENTQKKCHKPEDENCYKLYGGICNIQGCLYWY